VSVRCSSVACGPEVAPSLFPEYDAGMSEGVFAVLAAVLSALLGGVIGGLAGLRTERSRARAEVDRQRLEALRIISSNFVAAILKVRGLSYDLEKTRRVPIVPNRRRRKLIQQIDQHQSSALSLYQQLRLLSNSLALQEAARYSIRHSWAVWRMAEDGMDPRGTQYNEPPVKRLNDSLEELYREVRRELQLGATDAMFPESTD
jgi:hypothetical protein